MPKCKICDEELILPKVTCEVCCTDSNLATIELVDGLVHEYSRIQNIINKYSEDDWDDNYKTRAIKNTKLEVYKEVLNNVESLLKEYSNIDISKIEIRDFHVLKPRICDINKNKVCNHCMNC
jgi:hypothetical protein